MTTIGAVVIGRNEGDRLKACLHSLLKQDVKVVYVDSNSSDDSVAFAKQLGVTVIVLDTNVPFTAARARNAGFARLIETYPLIKYVQFVDGDCEVMVGWIAHATQWLEQQQGYAIVCGRRRERHPERSIYNQHCDIEWNTPVGDAKACGGDFVVRANVFSAINGFNASLIAGEEPEMCIRVRGLGWKIRRLDFDMTLHDANIMHFRQFWKRSVRSGYAFSKGVYLHGDPPEKHWVKEARRCLIWGGVLPFFIFITLFIYPVLSLSLCLLYPLQWYRILRQSKHLHRFAYWQATLLMVSKFSEFQGQLQFVRDIFTQKNSAIIEYH